MGVPGMSQTGIDLFDVMTTQPHYQPPLTPPPEEVSKGGPTTSLDEGLSAVESNCASIKGEEDAVFYRTLQQIQKVRIRLVINLMYQCFTRFTIEYPAILSDYFIGIMRVTDAIILLIIK